MKREKLLAADAAIDKIHRRCAADPEYYIFNWLITKDEHDSVSPRKKFPDKHYLRWLLRQWIAEQVVYTAKSRQLMVSWLLAAYGLWTAQFRPDSLVLWQSKKEEDAAPFIYERTPQHARMSLMLSELPGWLQVCQTSSGTFIPLASPDSNNPGKVNIAEMGSYARLTFPNGATVLGLAQGASQVESKVPTLFISDESSLQAEWASAMAAAKPAIEKDAKILAVGTMRLPSAYGEAIAPSWEVDPDGEGRGLSLFRTPEGVFGCRVHYSADPDKDPETPIGAAWFRGQTESGAYQGGVRGWRWQQHMEISPVARSGTLVLPDLAEQLELGLIVVRDLEPSETFGWSFDSGLDYGTLNRSAMLLYGMSPQGKRYLLWAYSRPATEIGGIGGFCREIRLCPWFPKVNGVIQADPTLWNKDQNALGGLVSKAQIFEENGVTLARAKANGQQADDVLIDRLNYYYWADPEDPLFLVCERAAFVLRKYWTTLMYQEWSEESMHDNAPKEKMKNLNVDEWDAAKYAEVYWSDYPKYIPQVEAGTLAWYKQKTDPRRKAAQKAPSGNLR